MVPLLIDSPTRRVLGRGHTVDPPAPGTEQIAVADEEAAKLSDLPPGRQLDYAEVSPALIVTVYLLPAPTERPESLDELRAQWQQANVDLTAHFEAYQDAHGRYQAAYTGMQNATNFATYYPQAMLASDAQNDESRALLLSLDALNEKVKATAKAVNLMQRDLVPIEPAP